MTIIYAIFLLGIVIFFHELGHFIAARLSGVRVLKFSLGFGPKIVGIRRGDTEYLISAIPLGGYVKMYGEEPGEEVPPESIHLSFSHKPVSRKAFIVFSGPLFNLILAVLIFTGIHIYGVSVLTSEIGEVAEDSPAMKAGLKKGDMVIEINDRPVKAWDELAGMIQRSPGKVLNLKVIRDGKPVELSVVPKKEKVKNLFGEEIEVGLIGIRPSEKTYVRRLNPVSALIEGFLKTVEVSYLTILSIIKLIQRVVPLETLGGPIMIFDIAKKSAETGALNFFGFMALISINLGILNLLPIPILDGGHLIFYLIEKLRGKPLSEKTISIAQRIGLALILLLISIAFYNDIIRLIQGKGTISDGLKK